jgi:hypothetical protein
MNAVQRQVYLLLINGLHELAYHQRYTLDALDLLLCSYKLPFEVPVSRVNIVCLARSPRLNKPLLILDVFLLQLNVLQLSLQLLEGGVVIATLCREAF